MGNLYSPSLFPDVRRTVAGGGGNPNALADAIRTLRTPPQQVHTGPTISWPGCTQLFWLYKIGTVFNPISGVYIFCYPNALGRWVPLYVGQTHNFRERLTDCLRQHDALPDVLRLGATHICALSVPGELAVRVNLETILRRTLNPPCNRQ